MEIHQSLNEYPTLHSENSDPAVLDRCLNTSSILSLKCAEREEGEGRGGDGEEKADSFEMRSVSPLVTLVKRFQDLLDSRAFTGKE